MKIRFMQIVDVWVGVPLCFLCSLWRLFAELVGLRRINEHPRKILIIELSEMGSTVAGYSAIQEARRVASNSTDGNDLLYFLTFARNREGVDILDIIPRDNVLTIDDSSFMRFFISAFVTLKTIRALRIDVVIDWELFSRFTMLYSFFSGASERIGFDNYTAEGLYRGNLLTKRVFYSPYLHISQNLLNTVYAVSCEVGKEPFPKNKPKEIDGIVPRFQPTIESLERIAKILPEDINDKKVIIINPDPGVLPIRGWPIDSYIELIKKIIGSFDDVIVLITGLRSSQTITSRIINAVQDPKLIDLTGKTKTLFDFMTLLTRSDLLVTNDGGPAHFAGLTDIRSVVFFGPESPHLYRPLANGSVTLFSSFCCSPCLSASNHRRSKCTSNQCLQVITVEMAYKAVMGALRC